MKNRDGPIRTGQRLPWLASSSRHQPCNGQMVLRIPARPRHRYPWATVSDMPPPTHRRAQVCGGARKRLRAFSLDNVTSLEDPTS
jgi:hypothetical protein